MKYGSNTNLYGVWEACTRPKHPKGIKSPNHQYLPATFMHCVGPERGPEYGPERGGRAQGGARGHGCEAWVAVWI